MRSRQIACSLPPSEPVLVTRVEVRTKNDDVLAYGSTGIQVSARTSTASRRRPDRAASQVVLVHGGMRRWLPVDLVRQWLAKVVVDRERRDEDRSRLF